MSRPFDEIEQWKDQESNNNIKKLLWYHFNYV
jgi:hypothetical protein